MKTVALIPLLFLAAAVATAQSNTPQSTGAKPAPATPTTPATAKGVGPKLELGMTEWNIGTIWWGDPAETQLVIKNVGDAPLTIEHVKTSCGCTVAQPNKSLLAPGESDSVKLTYNTRKGVVKVSQNVTVTTNDPQRPSVVIPVHGEVRPLFNATPTSAIAFNQISTESKLTQTVELTSAYDKPLHLKLKPVPANSPFDVALEELEPGKKYRLSATTRPPLTLGYRNEHVQFETGDATHPSFEINVTANALAPVSVLPSTIYIYSSQQKSTTPPPRQMRLMFLKDRKVEIKEFKSSFDKIRAQVITPPNQRPDPVFDTITFQVYVPNFDELPEAGATLEVITNDSKYPSFTIPIRRQVFNRPATPTAPVAKPGTTGGEIPKANPAQPKPTPTATPAAGQPTPPPSKGG